MTALSLGFFLAAQAGTDSPPRVLFLTHSAGYRHAVVARPSAEELSLAERRLVEAARGRFEVVATQDSGAITAENLANFQAVVFYTTGELPISEPDRQALIDWVRAGGGFAGVHCATDTLYRFPPYHEMIGGTFDGHPWHQEVRVRVEDRAHPATAHLGDSFSITDEIYQFKEWDASRAHVLLRLDTGDLAGAEPGRDYPLAWCRPFGQGRVFYTALGHREEVWADARFLTHLLEGIRWTMAPAREGDDEGFTALLGEGSLAEGWSVAGSGEVVLGDAEVTLTGGPGRWVHESTHENFILRLEYLFARGGERVHLHFWTDEQGAGGSMLGVSGDVETGTWHPLELVVAGGRAYLSGVGTPFAEMELAQRRSGRIAIEIPEGRAVRLRRIRVRDLPDDAESYRVLFAGEGTRGWRMAGPGGFDLAEGALTSRDGMGLFWHERELGDFMLFLDWKVSRARDNSGVFVRFPDPGEDPWVAVREGYEIQISDLDAPAHRTGSIYSFQDSTHVPTKPVGEWNHLEIEVRDQRYVVRINGEVVNEFLGERSERGRVGVQNHDPESRVSYRNIRVVELRHRP